MFRMVALSVALLVTAAIVGCGGGSASGPDTVQVSGVITLEGKPLEGADVYFQNEEFTGYGHTGPDGKFRLVQGAVAGKNKVYISKIEGGSSVNEDPESGMDLGQFQAAAEGNIDPAAAAAAPAGPKQLIPDAYSNPAQSKLTFDVPESGADNANFNL